MDLLPDGWIDLEPVLLDRSDGRIVLDCLVTRVCLGTDRHDDDPAWHPGTPVGVVVTAPDDGGRQATELERWLRDGASVTLLVAVPDPVLLVELGDDVLALDVDPARWAPGRAAD